jgi:hypothetical protein
MPPTLALVRHRRGQPAPLEKDIQVIVPPSKCGACGHSQAKQQALVGHIVKVKPATPVCAICTKNIQYFDEVLGCGHHFHADCVWRWLKSHTTHPKEKNVCPKCGLLPASGRLAGSGRRARKTSTSSDSSECSSSSCSSRSSNGSRCK